MTMTKTPEPGRPAAAAASAASADRPLALRLAPLAVLALAMAVVFSMGWHKYLSFETVGMNYDGLQSFVAQHLVLSLAIYAALYIAVVALSLPGGLIMTLAGGLLFGWQIGAPVTIVSATIGATLVFLIAKTSLGASLAQMAGPWLARLQDGFRQNALSYLLFLRLVPVFPFVVVNVAPAFLGVPLSTYMLGTLLGIIPGTAAFSSAGAGLGSVIVAQNAIHKACLATAATTPGHVCSYRIDTSALVTRELLIAFAALGLVALIPIAIKFWSRRHAAA
jgi:uncharacterized membrane protein YdjX (TVP38/TMEM64 family)